MLRGGRRETLDVWPSQCTTELVGIILECENGNVTLIPKLFKTVVIFIVVIYTGGKLWKLECKWEIIFLKEYADLEDLREKENNNKIVLITLLYSKWLNGRWEEETRYYYNNMQNELNEEIMRVDQQIYLVAFCSESFLLSWWIFFRDGWWVLSENKGIMQMRKVEQAWEQGNWTRLLG